MDFPIPTPEITGAPGTFGALGDGCYLVHAPLSEADWTKLRAERPRLVILGNGRVLLSEGESFVRAIGELRRRLGGNPLLWVPRVALPHRLAFLVWAGVDLLDTTEALWQAAEGRYLDPSLGALPAEDGPAATGCSCPGCANPAGRDLSRHAVESMRRELELVRGSARNGSLRALVESRLPAEPLLAEMLRYADREWSGLLDERTPVVGKGIRPYVIAESHRRPEIQRYRRRLLERYRPPASKRVLVLLPCSRTKPYRLSRSHRRFHQAFEGIQHPERFHVVSVTSPLGLVPRELEDVFPARHYDIPVTGEWDESERSAVLQPLTHLVAAGSYQAIVVHLDPDEYSFLRPALPTDRAVRWSAVDDRTTAPDAIARLAEALRECDAALPQTHESPLGVVREELAEIAAFQFGREPAEALFRAPLRLAGRPWFQRITDGKGTDFATWREERGLFHLTVAGALRFGPAPPGRVEVQPDVRLTGDLFVPGVKHADPSIRVGDAVCLFQRGELVGVGEAALPGPLMVELEHGLAVEVRHRRAVAPEPPAPMAIS